MVIDVLLTWLKEAGRFGILCRIHTISAVAKAYLRSHELLGLGTDVQLPVRDLVDVLRFLSNIVEGLKVVSGRCPSFLQR